jgi:MFS family permease
VGGFVADRYNRRTMVIISLGVWSLVTWLTGHVQSFDQMWWARAAMGVSEACYIPAALAFIADFHQGRTRSRAIGLHQTGIYAGLALGGIGGYIAETGSWRHGFTWFGVAGVLYAIVLLLALPHPVVSMERDTGEPPASVNVTGALRELLGVGSFLLLVLYFTLPAMPGWVMKNWLPSVLADAFHLGQSAAGFSATLYITLASLVGALLGGVFADRWMLRTPRGRIYTSVVGVGLLVPALIGVGFAPTLGVAIACLILFGLGWGLFDANNMPILCQIARPQLRATGYGLMNLVSVSGGAWVTVEMGTLRDRGAPLPLIFSLCAAVAAIAVVLALLIRLRPARDGTSLS